MRKGLKTLGNIQNEPLPRRKSARLAAKFNVENVKLGPNNTENVDLIQPQLKKFRNQFQLVDQQKEKANLENLENYLPNKLLNMRINLLRENPDLLKLIQDPNLQQYSKCETDYLRIHYLIGDKIEELMPSELLLEPIALGIFDYLRELEYRFLYELNFNLNHFQSNMDPAILDKRYSESSDFIIPREQCITTRMRYIVINWLVQVHDQFDLMPETLFIAITLLDLYLMKKIKELPKTKLQITGMSCLFIACKYEEIYSPTCADIALKAQNNFSVSEILEFERQILRTVGFNLTFPVPITFERRYSRLMDATNLEHSLAKYFIELTVLELGLNSLAPSLRACVALVLARLLSLTSFSIFRVSADDVPAGPEIKISNIDCDLSVILLIRSQWTARMQFHSGYSVEDLVEPLFEVATLVVRQNIDSPQRAIRDKYYSNKYQNIGQHPVLKRGLLEAIVESMSKSLNSK